MSLFVLHNQSGEIKQMQNNDLLPHGRGDWATIEVKDACNGDDFYVLDGKIAKRPALPRMLKKGKAPFIIDPGWFATGSTYTVTPEMGDPITFTDVEEDIRLVDPGKYNLTVDQPFPYRQFVKDIEVKHA